MRDWTDVVRVFTDYDVYDLAVAFHREITERFGGKAFKNAKLGWFRKKPITTLRVKIGYREEMNVITGAVGLKGISGFFIVGGDDGAPVLQARVLAKDRQKVEVVMGAVQARLEATSIYRGKAITAGKGFLNLSGVDGQKLVYNDKVYQDLKIHVWTIMEKPEDCLDAGIFQRKVLFAGGFGTGKTAAAFLTAQIAVKNGRTFIYVEPTGKHDISAIGLALDLASKYQPATILIDDVDREQRDHDPFVLGQIMSAIDGTLSKSNKILIVMVTNYPEKLAAGIQRPGRTDKIIRFNLFTGKDGVELLKKAIPGERLHPDTNWALVEQAIEGYMPAFVNEVATSAKLAAISTSEDGTWIVNDGMLVRSAEDLREQHKVCNSGVMGFKGN